MSQKIDNWFNNHANRSNSTAAADGSRGTLEPPKRRYLQEWQVYLRALIGEDGEPGPLVFSLGQVWRLTLAPVTTPVMGA